VLYVTTGNDDVSAISVKNGQDHLAAHVEDLAEDRDRLLRVAETAASASARASSTSDKLDGKVVALSRDRRAGLVQAASAVAEGRHVSPARPSMDGKLYIGVVRRDFGFRAFLSRSTPQRQVGGASTRFRPEGIPAATLASGSKAYLRVARPLVDPASTRSIG